MEFFLENLSRVSSLTLVFWSKKMLGCYLIFFILAMYSWLWQAWNSQCSMTKGLMEMGFSVSCTKNKTDSGISVGECLENTRGIIDYHSFHEYPQIIHEQQAYASLTVLSGATYGQHLIMKHLFMMRSM